MLIDTHCHLDTHYFSEGPGPVLARARAAGVGAFVCIGVGSLEGARQASELAQQHADVVASAGVHPHDATSWSTSLESRLLELLALPSTVAVGEVGLDYHYEHSPRELQQRLLRRFVGVARELAKPLVIHTRSAGQEALHILEQERAQIVGGVIHCFSEDKAFAERALGLNFDLSFSGILTFKNATTVQQVAQWAPADRLMVETDSPYLAPVPRRGKRCEPADLRHTAQKLATLRGLPLAELEQLSTQNACRRFGPALAAAAASARQLIHPPEAPPPAAC